MNNPLVSVVMVVCNVDRFLAESIESILGQTFRQFEFIIVDFGSTDESRAIISKYGANDNRLKFHTIPHCGLAEARNVSCSLARSRYIAIMDADDISVPNRLIWQIEFMEKHPEVGVLGGAVEWIDATGKPLVTWRNPVEDNEIQLALLERCPLWQPTVIMRREAFTDVGGYRPPFAPAEDYDLWLRMAEHFHFANLEQVVLKYRIHPHQVSMRHRAQQTFSVLAARVAASSRRSGIPDPLNSVMEITPEALAALGVTKARQQSELASERRQWIRNMCMAGEYSVALQAALETLQSDLEYVERWQIADLHLIVARLYWRQKKFLSSLLAAAYAVVTRPVVAGRPLNSMLRGLRRR
jgi:cellulose synthase/poly-beta-1,6-N-acetylglucosamine synthase-like glycosyltransferase